MKKYTIVILILLLSTILIQMGCENNYPDSIWDPNYSSKPTPVITDISPDSSYSGIGIVTITGQHFSADISENRVFIGGQPAIVLSASETSIEVQVPALVEDSLLIQVNVKGAYLLGEYGKNPGDTPFKLNDALIRYLYFDFTKTLTGLACDQNEYIYTNLNSPRSIIQITNPDSTDFPQYSSSPTTRAYGMKWGPGAQLYLVRKNKNMYRTLVGGGGTEIVGKTSESLYDLDFDQNGNILTAGKEGRIFSMTTAGDTATVAQYGEDYDITVLRVYDGYLYSVLDYQGSDTTLVQRGIWRNQILDANSTLGPNELMFDWDTYAGKFGPRITAILVDENGMFYLGSNFDDGVMRQEDEAIIKLDIFSGITEPLYPEILGAGVNNLVWGNTNFLYIHHYDKEIVDPTDPEADVVTRSLLKLAMPLNSAPYYGRQ
jgi:IPT/TIG domain-containing protein